jgi:hypothetical protein
MSSNLKCTAASLRAILAFIDPVNTPKIAFDKDEFSQPLIDKVKECVGDRDGSQPVSIWFEDSEGELKRQFSGLCHVIKSVFDNLNFCTGETTFENN